MQRLERLAIGSMAALAAMHAWVAAQPEPGAQPEPAAQPASPGQLAPPAQPTAAATAAPAPPTVEAARPTELALAIGVGYAFPTSLQTPNVTSVRVRLASGLTVEPQLTLSTTSNTIDTGSTIMSRQTTLQIGSLVRYPLRVRGKIDVEVIGSAAVSNQTIDPNGDNNNQTITSLSLGYGLGLAYWPSPHWNVSLTATNPLFAFTRTRQEMGPDAATIDRSTTIGLVFDPHVALMLHLYD